MKMRKLIVLMLVAFITLGWAGVAMGYNTPPVTIVGTAPYQVDISWSPPTDVPSAVYGNVFFYEIDRCIPSSPNLFQSLGTVAANVYSFSDDRVTPGHQYMYAIYPLYQSSIGFEYNRSGIVTAPLSTTGLPNPKAILRIQNPERPLSPAITVESIRPNQVNFSWEPFNVTDAVYGQLERYSIGRSTTDYPNFIYYLGSVLSNMYSYSDTTVMSGEQYLYSTEPRFTLQQPLFELRSSAPVAIPYHSSPSSISSGSTGFTPATSSIPSTTAVTSKPVTKPPLPATPTQQVISKTQESNTPAVMVNGTPLVFDVAPEIVEGRTFVPIRPFAYALGLTGDDVGWDADTQTVTITKDSTVIALTIGSPIILVNDAQVESAVTPYIKDGRTMIPIRLIVELLGASVEWDGDTRQIIISV